MLKKQRIGKVTVRSANRKSDDWPFWMVWNGNLNVTGPVLIELEYATYPGFLFVPREDAEELAAEWNSQLQAREEQCGQHARHQVARQVAHSEACAPCREGVALMPDPKDRDPAEEQKRAVTEALVALIAVHKEWEKTHEDHGTIQCLRCGGVFHWRRAKSNGHFAGSCETEGCVRFFQ